GSVGDVAGQLALDSVQDRAGRIRGGSREGCRGMFHVEQFLLPIAEVGYRLVAWLHLGLTKINAPPQQSRRGFTFLSAPLPRPPTRGHPPHPPPAAPPPRPPGIGAPPLCSTPLKTVPAPPPTLPPTFPPPSVIPPPATTPSRCNSRVTWPCLISRFSWRS